jgi:hypothetical protein
MPEPWNEHKRVTAPCFGFAGIVIGASASHALCNAAKLGVDGPNYREEQHAGQI